MENRGTQSSGSRSTGSHWRHDPGAIPYTFGPSSAPFYEVFMASRDFPLATFLISGALWKGTHPWGPPPRPEPSPLSVSILLMLSELLCAVSMLLFTSMREKQTLGGDTLFISARRL